MNIDFLLYDSQGNIFKTGHCPKEVIPFVKKHGGTLLIGFANQKTQKIVNNRIVDKTPEEIGVDRPLESK